MSTTPSDPLLSWREGRRRQAWELHQQGWTQSQIGTALGVTQGAVSQWLHRATTDGVEALRAHPAPGPRPRLTPSQLAQLPPLLAAGAEAYGFRGDVWTRRRVAHLIVEQFGVRYHPRHVGRLLAQLDWTVQQPLQQASQRDEAVIAAWYATDWPAIKKKPISRGEPSSG